MPTVHPTLPSDGDDAIVEPYNTAIDAILGVINGNIDSDNIASVDGSKLIAGSVPQSALSTAVGSGWISAGFTPNTVVYNGNRSYSLTFSGHDLTNILSPGMRLQLSRTVAAPPQCTTLNGSTQYYSKSSPAGMTFTDDFICSAWIKLSSYASGNAITSRYNGTSGFIFEILSTGQVSLTGFNGGGSNFSRVNSVQAIPLNKWVHVVAQLDMSSFSVSSTTSYAMIDGMNAVAVVSRGGSNPTALIQAGNLEVGSNNGGSELFNGELAQVAIYGAKVTQANVIATISQKLVGTETSLISAYSFNNSINDLNANANNLSANGSAVATTNDSPFAQGTTAGIIEYGIIMAISFSTDTTCVVQTAEKSAIPTSGGLSSVNYSAYKVPYGFPAQREKWILRFFPGVTLLQGSPSTNTWYNVNAVLDIPIGAWKLGYQGIVEITTSSAAIDCYATLSTGTSSESEGLFTVRQTINITTSTSANIWSVQRSLEVNLAAATPYYLLIRTGGNASAIQVRGEGPALGERTIIEAECAYI